MMSHLKLFVKMRSLPVRHTVFRDFCDDFSPILLILPCDCMQCNIRYCCRNSVRPSVRLSVRPSVRRVYCDKTKWWTADILVQHEKAITLVFWHLQLLVGDPLFPVIYSPIVTHPVEKRRLRQISAHNGTTVRNSKKFNYDKYKVDHGLSNEL